MKTYRNVFSISMAASLLLSMPVAFSQNVGIGTSNPTLAKLQINGTVGGSVAIFGADKVGVTISADNPEIGFNYFFNGGSKTIKTGYAALIGMNPGDGSLYIGNFNGNQSAGDQGAITGYRNALVVRQNGRIGIGVDNPVRAVVEQNGSVVNTTAIFGADGKGVSLEKDWPAVGLNHYYDGQHKSIGGGYGAQIGVDQNTGAIYFAQFSNSAAVPNGLYLNPLAAINFRYGKIGVNTADPQAPIEIRNTLDAGIENRAFLGLRLTDINNQFWNIFSGNNLFFCHAGVVRAVISNIDGTYYTYSDSRLKRDIQTIQTDVLHNLLQLHPATYLMKDEPNANTDRHIGFMAQELAEKFPETVKQDANGFLMVNYAGLVPILTKAIQEQQVMIEKQQRQIDELIRLQSLASVSHLK